MSVEGTRESAGDSEDFGLSGHLASIERMHRDALAQLDALAQPWGNLWSAQVAGTRPEEQPAITGGRHGVHAAAA